MKWARRKNDDPTHPSSYKSAAAMPAAIRKEHEDYIELIKDPADFLKDKKCQKWYICQSVQEQEIVRNFSADDRFSYEAFVGGFLVYFEMYASKFENDQRTVYFDWQTDGPGVPLTIYLYPVHTHNAYYDKNDQPKNQGGWGRAGKAQHSPMAPPPADGQTDPPGVPVPPPPPRRFEDQA